MIMARRRIPTQSIQLHLRIRKPKGIKITRELLQSAVDRFIETGEETPGITITGVVWIKGEREYPYSDPEQFQEILSKAKKAHLSPRVFSLASDE
jgi:hypothetical protein